MENKNSFKPFIPANKVVPEFTATSVILGAILAVVFGGANAYLGLRVGMTVSASIPAAVISMGIIRLILKRDSILENNMVQTIGSSGESIAAGIIFTIPAIFMWAASGQVAAPGLLTMTLIALCGGILGVMFMIPLRTALIVKEHGVLPYPEGTACAEVLMAGEEGGVKAGSVFKGLGIAAVYKLIADGLCLFPSEVTFAIKPYKGSGIGMDVLPALAGVGYICGVRISSWMMAGGALAWFVIMPVIAAFGNDTTMFPGTVPIGQMSPDDIWSNYVRYIGAGAVAAGGIISLVGSLPLIVKTFAEAVKEFNVKGENSVERTSQELSLKIIIIGIIIAVVVMWATPSIPVNLLGALLIVIFGFFFATVSSRMVGLVGSSNNPVSGMTIATLLITTIVLKAVGQTGISGMVSAITIGAVICIVAALAGDMSQDLKTGYIVGATPKKQQIGQLIGVLSSSLAIGGILFLLNKAWGYGSKELPAPQATLMKLVVEGVMGSSLPWDLVFVGIGIAIVIWILRVPILPFAIGLYLPIYLSTPIMVGGLIRWYFEEKKKFSSEAHKANVVENGVLYTSGMIAGEGLVGILLAAFAVIPIKGGSLLEFINLSSHGITIGNIGGLIVFFLLMLTLLKATIWNKKLK